MSKYNKPLYRTLLILIFGFGMWSCSVKRFIPEEEVLYTGAELKLNLPDSIGNISEVERELQEVLGPTPNSKFLGMRPGLFYYYKSQKDSAGFIYRWLNKNFGEEPVYLSEVNPQRKEELILNRLDNNGFFNSEISSEIDSTAHLAAVEYTADLGRPYTLKNYRVETDTLPIYGQISQIIGETPLDNGSRFDLELLKFERQRIDNRLKEKGYYNFNPQFLIFEADTNQYKNRKFDLFLRLKKEVPKKSMVPYTIDSIAVYPNYSVEEEQKKLDTISVNGITHLQSEEFFKLERLDPYILLKEGQKYNPNFAKRTSDRLSDLGSYKYVNIRFQEIDSVTDADGKGSLAANIYLSPLTRRALRAELRAVTKSNGFTGPGIAVTYSNRNLFGGGETLNIIGDFSYEAQLSGGNNRGLGSLAGGLETELIIPRLVPISPSKFDYSVPKTRISLGFDFLNRSKLYSLNSFNTSFGYTWNENRYVTHQLDLIHISYANLSNTTPEFEQLLDENPFLSRSFEQQFIAGLNYAFTYSELMEVQKTHSIFFNANLDVAGNILNLFSGNKKTIFGTEYAQYAKADVDFRYYLRWGKEQVLASRIFAGLGIPYGNSSTLPFVKQYFSGGPYSVRAFEIRSLGPGSFSTDDEGITFFDQSGNLRLEGNLEYRFPLFSYLKGALFVDAGNVWLTKAMEIPDDSEIANTPLGEELFDKGQFGSDWASQLGVGAGFGLRVDIQNFVIRLDLASPVRVPSLPKGEQSRIPFFDEGSNNLVFNFAIGYPF